MSVAWVDHRRKTRSRRSTARRAASLEPSRSTTSIPPGPATGGTCTVEGPRPVFDVPPSEIERIASVDAGQLTVVTQTGEVWHLDLSKVAGVTTRHRATLSGGIVGGGFGFVLGGLTALFADGGSPLPALPAEPPALVGDVGRDRADSHRRSGRSSGRSSGMPFLRGTASRSVTQGFRPNRRRSSAVEGVRHAALQPLNALAGSQRMSPKPAMKRASSISKRQNEKSSSATVSTVARPAGEVADAGVGLVVGSQRGRRDP